MYNEAVKIEFMDTIKESTHVKYKSLFNKSEVIETKYGLDIMRMTVGQIIEVIENYSDKDSTRQTCLSQIRKYMAWAEQVGYIKINIMSKSLVPTSEIMESMQDRSMEKRMTEEEYRECLDKIVESKGGKYAASILMSIYEGISGNNYTNLFNAKLGDIDEEAGTIKLHDGTERKISKELISLLKEVSTMDGCKKRSKYADIIKEDVIWKGANSRNFKFIIDNTVLNITGVKYSKNEIEKSGFFNRVMDLSIKAGYDFKADMLEVEDKKNPSGRGDKYKLILKELGVEDVSFFNMRYSFKKWASTL